MHFSGGSFPNHGWKERKEGKEVEEDDDAEKRAEKRTGKVGEEEGGGRTRGGGGRRREWKEEGEVGGAERLVNDAGDSSSKC